MAARIAFRRMRAGVLVLLAWIGAVTPLSADIILSSEALHNALKRIERLRREVAAGAPATRAQALFQLATEADALAALINREVAAHGSQEQRLIDLAVARTAELDAAIAYHPEKKKFFYDNAAFRDYLRLEPAGPKAPDAEFKILEGEFFQSNQRDAPAVRASAARKAAFLRRYPRFTRTAEMSLMLAIDYRDLFRHYDEAGDARQRDRYLALARRQLRATATIYRDATEARIAAEILRRFDGERRQRARPD